jgi:formylmethanofuran dehydrogenase subunit B
MFFKKIVCTACGAACDDIQVEFREGTIKAKNLCKIGNAKFKAITSPQRLKEPLLKGKGKLRPVYWDEGP